MTCRDCKFLDVKLDASGRRVVRKTNMYPCDAPITIPPLPHSVTKCYSYREPSRCYMSPQDGEGCPLYEKLAK